MAKKKVEQSEYQPIWTVGYGSHTLMLAAPTAEEAVREAHERDPVLRALPTVAEPVITADGFHAVALVTPDTDDIV